MTKIISSVDEKRFKKYQISFPEEWEVMYISAPYTDKQMIDICQNADYLLVNSTHPVSKTVIESSPSLKMIHVEGVGYDKVDVEAAKKAGIPVCNNRSVNNDAVAEHTIGLMLAGLRRTAYTDTQIKSEGFMASQQEHRAQGEHELQGKHVGILGFGAIGREVAARLSSWVCRVSYYDSYRPSQEVELRLHVDYLDFDALIRTCDIISVHVPVLPETINLISKAQLAAMKPSALLVNTARGEIINSYDLAEALERGQIYGAALDTLSPEPPPSNHPLLNLSPEARKRLTITPHIGGTTDEAFMRMLQNVIMNMKKMEAGEKPDNVVNSVT